MTPAKATKQRRASKEDTGTCIVAIGASAGGLDALKEFLRLMPTGNRLAFIVIQHLDPTHESHTPELLAKCTAMPVEPARNGLAIQPDHVYTNPPGKTLSIKGGHLRVTALKPATRRLPIDHFFHALGDDQRQRAIGVILSGSGADGSIGLRTIAANGGLVIVQEPTTAQFDGMPRSAIQSGLVNAILPIARIPDALSNYARHPYATQAEIPALDKDSEQAAFAATLELLRERRRIDFTGYKRTMLDRRIHRRMGLRGVGTLQQYTKVLADDHSEVDALCRDLLIGVTVFFRDPAAWHELEAEVIGPLVREREPGVPIRVWVAGCATGEEAYSIAMLLTEHLEREGKRCPVQVLATDASDDAIAVARAGVYPSGISQQVSNERLLRFFAEVPGENRYKVKDDLRACVVFARHDLLHDPAYSKLDLVICRNLLIYLQAAHQEKILRLFHFGLRPNGGLFLGAAESLGRNEERFKAVSDKWRIFRHGGKGAEAPLSLPGRSLASAATSSVRSSSPPPFPGSDLAGVVQRQIMEKFAPAAVLINSKFKALYFVGPTDRYLTQPKGRPTNDLLALAREGLRSQLKQAVLQAHASHTTVVVDAARVRRDSSYEAVHLTVLPVSAIRDEEDLLLAVFEQVQAAPALELDSGDAAAKLVRQLEYELDATRSDLRDTIERMVAATESARSVNEESLSVNEELQSANEELESSKEELQALNEELNTVNQQLQLKITELESAERDLRILLASSEIATICLDSNFCLKWFSPTAMTLFGLRSSDVGRPIGAFSPMLSDPQVVSEVRRVLSERHRAQSEISPDGEHWYLRRILPLTDPDEVTEGAIMTFVDITEIRRKAQQEIAARTARSQSLEYQVKERVRLLRLELFKLAVSEERDRRAIAIEIHDRLCQPLAVAAMRLSRDPRPFVSPHAGARDGKGDEAQESTIPDTSLVALIEKAEGAARRLMYRLSPPVLHDLGLVSALEWLADEMQRDYGLEVTVETSESGSIPTLDPTVRSLLFRCVQELLVNVAKHAKVNRAELSVSVKKRRLLVTVSDGGVGFSEPIVAQPGVGGQFGLVSIRERIGFIDGSFRIDSVPGDGTMAVLSVPLAAQSRARRLPED